MYKVVLEKDASFWSGAKAVGGTAMKGLNIIGNAAFPLMLVGSMVAPLFQKPPKEAPKQVQDPDRLPGNMKFAAHGGSVKVAFTMSGITDKLKGLFATNKAEDIPVQHITFDPTGKEAKVSKTLTVSKGDPLKQGYIRYDTKWGVVDVPKPFAKKHGYGSKKQLEGKKLPGGIRSRLKVMEETGVVTNYTKKQKPGAVVIRENKPEIKPKSEPKLLKARIPVKTVVQKAPDVAAGTVAGAAGAGAKPAVGLGSMWKATPPTMKGALVGAGAMGLASLLLKKKKEEPSEKNMFKIGAYSLGASGEYEAYIHPLLTKEALFGWLRRKPGSKVSIGKTPETETMPVTRFGAPVDEPPPIKYKKEPKIPGTPGVNDVKAPTLPDTGSTKMPAADKVNAPKTPGLKDSIKNTWTALPRWGKGMSLVGAGLAAGALLSRMRKDDAQEERTMFRLG